MPAVAKNPHQAAVREQILNFLSLSSDIARNQYDAEFSSGGGQIIYCFDQTIFNLFFDTVQWRHAVSSFYRRTWEMPGDSGREVREQWSRIQSQSALIASEYLLSEDLAGAKNRNIYLTPWHRHELALRLEEISEEIDKGSIDKDKITSEIRKKLEFLTLIRSFRDGSDTTPFRSDPLLEGDLVKLRSDISDGVALQRYEITRRAAAMLVGCEASERLDQVYRLISKPLRPRLKSLHHLFQPSDAELDMLTSDAKKWHLRILHEFKRSGRGRRSARTIGGMWNDARSIAFVRWASAKVRRDQRLILVTSDDTLFDAYRRWWCDEGASEAGEVEPFVLRRSFQYTPIFNFRDSYNDLSRLEGMETQLGKLFTQISEAIHLTLLPFNLFQTGTALGALAHNQNFQYMAQRGRDRREDKEDPVLDFYLSRFPADFYEQRSAEIGDITDLWREIERVGIGFFYDQVVKRLEDDRYLFGIDDASEPSPQNVEQALRYLSRILETITNRTRLAYLPLAQSFLAQFDGGATLVARAPDLLWYRSPARRSIYELMMSWSGLSPRERQATIQELSRLPEAPFVFAAAFALGKEEWWRAAEFADYALESFRAHDTPAPRTEAELLFLCAFTKRFRLGSSGLVDSLRDSGGPEEMFRAALHRSDDLYVSSELLLDKYFEIVRDLKLEQEAKLYIIRGKSERAALRLFMALHLYFRTRDNPETVVADPLDYLRRAQEDLLDCFSLDKSISASELRERQKAIRAHFVHNAAASEVCRFLIDPTQGFQLDDRLSPMLAHFGTRQQRQSEDGDPLVKVERIVFQILQKTADAREWPELEKALAELKQAGLTLDRLYADQIASREDDLFQRLTEASRPRPGQS